MLCYVIRVDNVFFALYLYVCVLCAANMQNKEMPLSKCRYADALRCSLLVQQ